MIPEAWNIEHNRLHHYSLNQAEDPDLVQRNVDFVRDANVPIIFKYMLVALFLPIWKWYYYAPNTYKELKVNELLKAGKELPKGFDPKEAVTIGSLINPRSKGIRKIIKPIDFLVRGSNPVSFISHPQCRVITCSTCISQSHTCRAVNQCAFLYNNRDESLWRGYVHL